MIAGGVADDVLPLLQIGARIAMLTGVYKKRSQNIPQNKLTYCCQ
jgi:hypothetical protein